MCVLRLRKRADRANQPFALIVMTLNERPGADRSPAWAPIIAAVATATRRTDVLGWIERGSALGVVLTAIPALDGDLASALETRFKRRLLMGRTRADAVARCLIRIHVYSRLGRAGEKELPSNDLLLLMHGSGGKRATVYDATKRALDVIGSLTLLVGLAPLFLLIAIAVKVNSRGPVLFRQVRVGQMLRPFVFLKFRTMSADVNHAIHQEFVTRFIRGDGTLQQPGKTASFKIVNDTRVTGVGRILRRTSLDELPQLWNVLRGDMSLVGPRPPIQYEVDNYQSWHRRRVLEAKPGITGLWQVKGRSRTTFDEMVRLDLRYARTRSLWTDLKILLATPAAVISGKGAC